MKKYYVPKRMYILDDYEKVEWPSGVIGVLLVFTNKRKMVKYYGKEVEYREVILPSKKKGK